MSVVWNMSREDRAVTWAIFGDDAVDELRFDRVQDEIGHSRNMVSVRVYGDPIKPFEQRTYKIKDT